MKLEEVPCPQIMLGRLLVETKASLVSAGTEKMLVDLAKKSLIGKAKSRPDLVMKVINTAKKEGILSTFQKVQSKLDTPIPLGYSCAGIVKEISPDVDEFRVGDLVACGGAGYANHAEFNLVPKNLCVKIPSRLDSTGQTASLGFDEAAFATVGAIALQGVRQAALTLGERVCVIGLGLLGQLTVQICKAAGCRVVGADIDMAKVELSKKHGADEAVHSKELENVISRFTEGMGADAVIITAASHSSELVGLAGEISRMKGRVIAVGLVGLDVPRDTYYKKELDLRLSMSYGPGRYDVEYEERGHDYPLPYVRWTEQRNMQAIIEMIAGEQINVRSLITHHYPFNESLDAYQMILDGKSPYMGVILNYNATPEPDRIPVMKNMAGLVSGEFGIGLIGAGNFAKSVLLPRMAKQPGVRMQGVTTARGMTAKAVAEQFHFAYCTDQKEQIWSDNAVHCVVIATRHNLHGPLVEAALAVGKHIFVEKPLCIQTDELQRITKRYTVLLQAGEAPIITVGFNRRFSPFIQKAREVLTKRMSPLVASYRINAGFIPKGSWIQDPVEGGGRILGEVCHFVDTLRFLVGAPVKSVQATCIQSADKTQVSRDSVAISLTYEDGSLGTILYHAVGNADYPKEKLEIAADGTVLVLDDFQQLDIFGKKKVVLKSKQDKGFDAEIAAFFKAVKDGAPPPIPFSELVETTAVTFAIHRALDTGTSVILRDFIANLKAPDIGIAR